MKNKSITLELPEFVNWIAQDQDRRICIYECEPIEVSEGFDVVKGNYEDLNLARYHLKAENWRESKINLNTHGAYIDANGILHRCELVPDMLKPQAD